MDRNFNNLNNGSSRFQTSSSSAEDRINKRLKSMGSGMGSGLSANTTRLNLNKDTTSNSSTRKKVGGVVLDIEAIEDATRQRFDTKGKRNNVIILVLSLLLAVSLVYLAIAIIGYNKSKKVPNCIYKLNSQVSAKWIVEGGGDTEIVVKEGLAPDMIYLLNSSLEINDASSVSLTLEIRVWLEGNEITISGLHLPNDNLVRVQNSNSTDKHIKYAYQGSITGGGKIEMFKGLDFSDTPGNLNSNNVKIEVIANIQKI